MKLSIFFFFQAEDGIRDYKVTGVQTCALPISVGEVDQLDDAVHHRVAEGDQREDGATGEAVDRLLDENLPPGHLDGGPRHGPPYPPTGASIELGARSRQRARGRPKPPTGASIELGARSRQRARHGGRLVAPRRSRGAPRHSACSGGATRGWSRTGTCTRSACPPSPL